MFTSELNVESGLETPTINTLKGKTKKMSSFYVAGTHLNYRKQLGGIDIIVEWEGALRDSYSNLLSSFKRI